MRKTRCSLKDIFMAFLFLRNKETNTAQDPKGDNLVLYLRSQYGFKSSLHVNQRLNELVKLGYIERQCYNGEALFSVKLLKTRWQEQELVKKTKSKLVKAKKEKPVKIEEESKEKPVETMDQKDRLPVSIESAAPVVQQRKFAILIDYENLKMNVHPTKLLDFSWLFDPILSQGKIVGGYVFFPEHYGTNMPIKTLSNIHRLFCVACPKDIKNNGVVKDKDIVDSRMDELGRFLVEHSDITDLVVVSGDADFQGLIQFAHWQQKTVKVVSAKSALSSRLRFDEKLEKQIII